MDRKKQLENSIKSVFETKLLNLSNKIEILNLVINRYNYYKDIHCDKDIDILDRIIQIKKLNSKIHKINENLIGNEADKIKSFNTSGTGSLRYSLFVEDPAPAINKSLCKYDFLPLSEKYLNVLKNLFKDSTTVATPHITNELLVVLPKIKSGCLLYRVSKDGLDPKKFHDLCDNKGK